MTSRAATESRLELYVLGNRAGTFSAIPTQGRVIGNEATDCLSDSSGSNNYVTVDGAVRRYPYFQIVSDRESPAAQGDQLQLLSNGELYLSGGDAAWKHTDSELGPLGSRAVSGERLQGVIAADELRVFERVTTGTQVSGTFRNRDF
jgi:hypothetical protein